MIILYSVLRKRLILCHQPFLTSEKSLFKPRFYPAIQLLSLAISLVLYGLCATQFKEKIVSYKKGYTATAKSLQSCPTLCDPIDSSPPGSPVPGILQARTLEWVAISFSNACKWKVKVKSLSRVWLLATPWTAAQQAPPSMGFSRQEY